MDKLIILLISVGVPCLIIIIYYAYRNLKPKLISSVFNSYEGTFGGRKKIKIKNITASKI
jgi:hypothetical protein